MVRSSTSDYRLKKLKSGEVTIHDTRVNETFHPGLGAELEAEELYIKPTKIRQHLRINSENKNPLVIWDVGLGAAGNAMAILNLWQGLGDAARLDLTIESFDIHTNALQFALKQHRIDEQYFSYLTGWDWDAIFSNKGGCWNMKNSKLQWHWHLADFTEKIKTTASLVLQPNFIFYDVHSPAKNYSLWRLEHFKALRSLLADIKTTDLIFHSRSTAVRVTLLLAGFFVGIGSQVGDKQETTIASNRLTHLEKPLDQSWLRRVQRSSAAQPFVGECYRPQKIESTWLEKLQSCSQWQ